MSMSSENRSISPKPLESDVPPLKSKRGAPGSAFVKQGVQCNAGLDKSHGRSSGQREPAWRYVLKLYGEITKRNW
jgi:hypothetical protein